MTREDQNTEIGHAASRYHRAHHEFECLRAKSRRYRQAHKDADELLSDLEEGRNRIGRGHTFPHAIKSVPTTHEINDLASKLYSKSEEVAELKADLDRLGFPFGPWKQGT